MTYHRMILLAHLVATVSSSSSNDRVVSNPVLQQLHVITRHGEDTKIHGEFAETSVRTLTPIGRKEMWDLGSWLRETYHTHHKKSERRQLHHSHHHHSHNPLKDYRRSLDNYHPQWHRFESSGFDLTLSSADALSKGLFPENNFTYVSGLEKGDDDNQDNLIFPEQTPSIPVYSTPEINDIILRPDQNCPVFEDRLQVLFDSKAWAELEQGHPLLVELAQYFPEYASVNQDLTATVDTSVNTPGNWMVPLKDVDKVYDAILVERAQCSKKPDACKYDWLEGFELLELQHLVQTTEQMKYGAITAGNLLGSNVLSRALSRFDAGTLFVYSAHAPTILGLLGTLWEELDDDERGVEYGSAIIIEVYHDDSNDLYLRFLYKSGGSTSARYLELEHAHCSSQFVRTSAGDSDITNTTIGTGTFTSTTYCKLSDFMNWAQTHAILSQQEWCKACGNDSSDVCMKALLPNEERIAEHTPPNYKSLTNEPAINAGSFLFGLAIGLLVVASCNLCRTVLRRMNSCDDEDTNSSSDKDTVAYDGSVEIVLEEGGDVTNSYMHDDEVYELHLGPPDQERLRKRPTSPPQSIWENVSKVV